MADKTSELAFYEMAQEYVRARVAADNMAEMLVGRAGQPINAVTFQTAWDAFIASPIAKANPEIVNDLRSMIRVR